MQKATYIFSFFLLLLVSSFRIEKKEKIKWLSFTQLSEAYSKQPKPIIIDVYTNWCVWCKVMDKKTYGNDKVINYINEHYYAVKFNAESRDTISFLNKKYGYNAAYNTHDLAVYLLQGDLSYPTTVLLSSLDAYPAPIAGFLEPPALEGPLKYFGDGAYKQQSFNDFMNTFTKSW